VRRFVRAGLMLAGLAACAEKPASAAQDDVEYFPAPTAAGQTPLPFSSAVRVGKMVYLAGAIGNDSTGKLVPGGIEAETKQTLENIRAVLTRVGTTPDHVVKCTAMLADMAEWDRMNAVYVTFFKPGRYPARSALGANGLARGARIELECWATMP
jgi:2-iminobutanoate/2-iminopropanoate deaminase